MDIFVRLFVGVVVVRVRATATTGVIVRVGKFSLNSFHQRIHSLPHQHTHTHTYTKSLFLNIVLEFIRIRACICDCFCMLTFFQPFFSSAHNSPIFHLFRWFSRSLCIQFEGSNYFLRFLLTWICILLKNNFNDIPIFMINSKTKAESLVRSFEILYIEKRRSNIECARAEQRVNQNKKRRTLTKFKRNSIVFRCVVDVGVCDVSCFGWRRWRRQLAWGHWGAHLTFV